MVDSNITKRVLANTLQSLMEEKPFEKISVAQICEQCNMCRKSFYYHFKDKYDLLHWIFDMDFITCLQDFEATDSYAEQIDVIEAVSELFYKNKSFYRKALKIQGQNSFPGHLRNRCLPIIKLQLIYILGEDAADEFTINFYADAMFCALERWIMEKDVMAPDQFVARLKLLVCGGAEAIHQKITELD